MSFIKTIFLQDLKRAQGNERVQARVQNIAWPSESMAQLGQIPVGECKRAMFYKIVGVKPTNPFTVSGQNICDAGIMYEKFHTNKFKEAGVHVKEQVRIEYIMPDTINKVIVSGKGDELISDNGKLKLIEIKSISAYKAPRIMGNDKTLALPAPNNLMQAMLYKYYYSNTDQGKSEGVDEVYLMYINRSDGSTLYYKVDLDENGYAIITAIGATGKEIYNLELSKVPSFSNLLANAGICDSDQSRMAELRISVKDIFDKFDLAYNHARASALPDKDYSLVYTKEEIEREFKLGRLSKIKYNKAITGKDIYGDFKCQYCSYAKQCSKDSGLRLS